MLNFKQFLNNAGAFLSGPNDFDAVTSKVNLPDTYLGLPTKSMDKPVTIFRIRKTGRVYEIFGDRNLVWNCPAPHFEHLLRNGKAPHVGDQVKLTFYGDGSVKTFEVVNS